MADTIHLEIVTPDGLKLAADVSEFTAPSVNGEFGVLPGHVPLLTALATSATPIAALTRAIRGRRRPRASQPSVATPADATITGISPAA